MLKRYLVENIAKPAAIHLADPFSVRGLGKIVLYGLLSLLFLQHLKLWGLLSTPLNALEDSMVVLMYTLTHVAIGMRFRFVVLRSIRQEMENRKRP